MKISRAGLWSNGDFLKLWAGQSLSGLGYRMTLLAVPLTAVLTLDATPAQMGILSAAGSAPNLLIGLFAGAWVDRLHKRPVMILADAGRAVLLASIPISSFTGWLSLWQLYIVAFLVGILSVFFDVANGTFLPLVVGRDHLLEANSKLHASSAVAEFAGPGLAGAFIQALTAPIAILVNIAALLGAVWFVGLIRRPEPAVSTQAQRNIWREVWEGLRVVLDTALLRSLAVSGIIFILFDYVLISMCVLYVTRELGISPGILGTIYSVGGVGALIGALSANHMARRFGLGTVIMIAPLVGGLAALLIPLAAGLRSVAVPLLMVAQFGFSFWGPVFTVNAVSLRQSLAPTRLLGRVNASNRFLVFGTMPIGSLLGGMLAGAIGLRSTLVIAGLGMLLAFLWLFFSPVRALHQLPSQLEELGSRSNA